ncbi:hypothetical protein BJ912DRAFT_1112351 [Pholiota molesta]|nr:hypothetical protein BJ912DRAFT_1112351 [Pholiota molesta]
MALRTTEAGNSYSVTNIVTFRVGVANRNHSTTRPTTSPFVEISSDSGLRSGIYPSLCAVQGRTSQCRPSRTLAGWPRFDEPNRRSRHPPLPVLGDEPRRARCARQTRRGGAPAPHGMACSGQSHSCWLSAEQGLAGVSAETCVGPRLPLGTGHIAPPPQQQCERARASLRKRGDEATRTTAAGVGVRRAPGVGVNEERDERGGDPGGAGRRTCSARGCGCWSRAVLALAGDASDGCPAAWARTGTGSLLDFANLRNVDAPPSRRSSQRYPSFTLSTAARRVQTIDASRRACFDKPNSRSQHPHRRPRRRTANAPGTAYAARPTQRGDEDDSGGIDVHREPDVGEEWDARGGDPAGGAGRHAAPEGVIAGAGACVTPRAVRLMDGLSPGHEPVFEAVIYGSDLLRDPRLWNRVVQPHAHPPTSLPIDISSDSGLRSSIDPSLCAIQGQRRVQTIDSLPMLRCAQQSITTSPPPSSPPQRERARASLRSAATRRSAGGTDVRRAPAVDGAWDERRCWTACSAGGCGCGSRGVRATAGGASDGWPVAWARTGTYFQYNDPINVERTKRVNKHDTLD